MRVVVAGLGVQGRKRRRIAGDDFIAAVDPVNTDVVYAGSTKGLFQTKNRGAVWERIGLALQDPYISSIVLHPTDRNVLYIGGPGGVWKSTDSGRTFQAMNNGLSTLNIRTLAMSPRNQQELFTGTNGSGLYHSTDGGEHWMPMPLKAAVPLH